MIAVGTIVVGLALWQAAQYTLGWAALGGQGQLLPPVVVRPHPLLGHANMVAVLINLLWPMALVQVATGEDAVRRVAASTWVVLAWTVILLASSRGAWLGAAVGLVTTLFLAWRADGDDDKGWFPLPQLWKQRLLIGLGFLVLVATGGYAALWLFRRSVLRGFGLGARRRFWEAAWQTFLSHPVLGLGPDTFATAYLRHVSIPPGHFYLHAHSKPMHVLAENGLLGVAAGAALLGTVVWGARRQWKSAGTPQRRLLAGVIGALVTVSVHALVDTPTEAPVNAIIISVLTAILVTRRETQGAERRSRLWRGGVTVLVVLLVAVGAWSQAAYLPFYRGAAIAEAGDWQRAAPLLEIAVARDPGHALYNLTSAYVHGVLADANHPGALGIAIDRYQTTIQREPGYGLNYANLAALLWQRGEDGKALAAAEKAVEAAPREATFWLNVGFYREAQGDECQAADAYERTLTLRPRWAEAYYWRATDLRASVLKAWEPEMEQPGSDSLRQRARSALKAGREDEALALFDQTLKVDPGWIHGYLGRAEAHLQLEQLQEASRDAHMASYLVGVDPTTPLRATWLQAEIAHAEGRLDAATELAETALNGYRKQSIFGPGTWGASMRAWGPVYHRVGISADLLPQLKTIRLTDSEISRLVTLGTWYEEAGDVEKARNTYEEALQAAPDCTAAAERLALLDGS
jgi:tetratricopeptide (TPR) repeat protein